MRTVITGSGAGDDAAARDDAAAALLNGFEGVQLDPQAEAAIAAALEACAARAREADAAYETGGDAAADAAEEDPGESFVRVGERGHPYRGELEPPCQIEAFVPFTPDEPHWHSAGAEKPDMLIEWEEEQARKRAGMKGPSRE